MLANVMYRLSTQQRDGKSENCIDIWKNTEQIEIHFSWNRAGHPILGIVERVDPHHKRYLQEMELHFPLRGDWQPHTYMKLTRAMSMAMHYTDATVLSFAGSVSRSSLSVTEARNWLLNKTDTTRIK